MRTMGGEVGSMHGDVAVIRLDNPPVNGLGHALRVGVSSDEGPPRLEQEADVMVDGTDGVRDLLRALLA